MKKYCLSFLPLLLLACHQPAQNDKNVKAYDYCYSNKGGIFLFSLADKQETRLELDCSDPCLSPDGVRLAYTINVGPDAERKIAVMDLVDKKVTMPDSNCHNCYGPVWSPDGNYLAYNAFTNHNWNIKCVDKDNRHSVMITNGDGTLPGYFEPSWSADSKKIILQDMSNVYLYDVNGVLIKKIPVQDIDTTLALNSASRVLLTTGEDKLIFENESTDSIAASEPPTAIFAYDLHNKKTARLSPPGYNCFSPVLKGDTVFFSGVRGVIRHSSKINTYSADTNGGHFGLVFKDRSNLSCRLPGR